MATQEAINKQCLEFADRIETRIADLTGLDLTPLPRVHKDRDLLRKQQLGTIADWLDRVPTNPTKKIDTRLLKALALLETNWTKAEMEAALKGETDGDAE